MEERRSLLEDPTALLESLRMNRSQLRCLAAAFELARRLRDATSEAQILSPRDVFLVAEDLRRKRREFFVVLLLDSKKELIGKEVISIGTLNASLVHPRELFLPAISDAASEIVLVHNHPSGDLTPSEEDLALTRRIAEAGKLLGIELLDHVIVSRTGYKSLREEGII
jgi:DNA repair protein RadC